MKDKMSNARISNMGQTEIVGVAASREQISKRTRFDVFHRDGFKCRYCGRGQEDGVKLHVDHVHPVSKGGTNDMGNYVTACADCNLGKSAKVLKVGAGVKADAETFGLSFTDDGRAHWQFVIGQSTKHAAKITLFSWLSGEDNGTETVNMDFLNNRCLLFVTHGDFLKAAAYWGDARAERVNELFVA